MLVMVKVRQRVILHTSTCPIKILIPGWNKVKFKVLPIFILPHEILKETVFILIFNDFQVILFLQKAVVAQW